MPLVRLSDSLRMQSFELAFASLLFVLPLALAGVKDRPPQPSLHTTLHTSI